MFVKTQNGVTLVGVNECSKISIEGQNGLPRIVLTEGTTGAKTVLGIYLPAEAYTISDDITSALASGEKAYRMPLSARYSRGYPLSGKEIVMVSEKLSLTTHAIKRMKERGVLASCASDETALRTAKDAVLNAELAYYDNDGAVVVNVDNQHAYILKYNYLTSRYSVLTYTDPSENGYSVGDKQMYARTASQAHN